MARSVTAIDWSELTEAVPAFLTIVLHADTFSISHGLAAGFVSLRRHELAAGEDRGALARPRDRFASSSGILAALSRRRVGG